MMECYPEAAPPRPRPPRPRFPLRRIRTKLSFAELVLVLLFVVVVDAAVVRGLAEVGMVASNSVFFSILRFFPPLVPPLLLGL